MLKIAVVGLEKNGVWEFFNKLEEFKNGDIEFVPFIYSTKSDNLYDTLEINGNKVKEFSAAVSVGGDGTFLYTSRIFAGTDVPIFGVNKGHLGFNTTMEVDEFSMYFKQFLNNNVEYDYKSLLDVLIEGNDKIYTVLNEGVISYCGISRTIRLKVDVDDIPLCDFRGDGLIISSPTGSTAYNLSAGGPILHPSVDAFVLTPICPMTLAIRPFIIPFNKSVNIKIEESSSTSQITLDGQKIINLNLGQGIKIKRSKSRIKVIKGHKSFSEVLKTKLGWVV